MAYVVAAGFVMAWLVYRAIPWVAVEPLDGEAWRRSAFGRWSWRARSSWWFTTWRWSSAPSPGI